MTRREFASQLLKYTAGLTAVVISLSDNSNTASAAGSSLSFRAKVKGTVLVNTCYCYAISIRPNGLVTKVGSLSGNLNYFVNGKWIRAAASSYIVPQGTLIKWQKV